MKRSAAVQHSCDAKKMRKSPSLQKASKDGRTATCLPAEVLQNIAHCIDFNTLVALRFASRTFSSVVQTNAGILAKRRRMELVIDDDGTMILSEGKSRLTFRYDPSVPSTYVVAMRRVASHVGFHSLTTLCIADDWRRVPMDHLPALRFVETLQISMVTRRSSRIASVGDVSQFTRQFPHLQRFYLFAPGNPIFDWTAFLRTDGALKLPELVAGLIGNDRTKARSSVPSELDFLQYGFDCSRLAESVGKFVRLPSQIDASRSFLVTSLRRIEEANRTITVRFKMSVEPNLSTEEFSTDQLEQHGRAVTRYKSRNSSVCVYRKDAFVSVTNDPSFDPFIYVY